MVPVGFIKIKININIIAAKEVTQTFFVTSSVVIDIFLSSILIYLRIF